MFSCPDFLFLCLLTYNLPQATKGLKWLTTEAETINNAKMSIRIKNQDQGKCKENVERPERGSIITADFIEFFLCAKEFTCVSSLNSEKSSVT